MALPPISLAEKTCPKYLLRHSFLKPLCGKETWPVVTILSGVSRLQNLNRAAPDLPPAGFRRGYFQLEDSHPMRRIVTVMLAATVVLTLSASMLAGAAPDPAAAAQQASDPLVRLLAAKGVLTGEEVQALAAVPAAQQRDRLTSLLLKKGIITSRDLQGVSTSNERSVGFSTSAEPNLKPAVLVETMPSQAPPPPKPPAVIPAAAPIRVLQLGPAKVGGVAPTLKFGPIHVSPYGFFKSSVAYDSSSPLGNDFPLPGFLSANPGPGFSPEFHVKNRQFRIGSVFGWPDLSDKVAVTGKIEFDFEGDFTRVGNRNVSSIRSSQPSLRLAWGRIDYHATPETSVFLLAGQDWTPFGSSVLPSMLESTIYAVGFGNLYTREPQVRVGLFHKTNTSRSFGIGPEFAVVMPAFGQNPGGTAGLANQLAYGERIGADSAKPTIEGRLVFQFQADKAKGVAPAQIVFSGMHGTETALVPRTAITAVIASGTPSQITAATSALALYPGGVGADANRWGWQGAFSIPTRFATLQASYYRGANLRWYFEGQLYSTINRPLGTTLGFTTPDIDEEQTVAFLPNGQLVPIRPVRGQGGFAEIDLPLSRLAHANPEGRNAGWTMVFHYGYDSAFARDIRAANGGGGGRGISDLGLWNLQWKFNKFVSFGLEESYYRTRSVASTAGVLPSYNPEGTPSAQWHDFRSEFFTTLSF
jgi:hypothetical protein